MTFVDPDTGLVITCQHWEYEQFRAKYIKTKREVINGGEKNES